MEKFKTFLFCVWVGLCLVFAYFGSPSRKINKLQEYAENIEDYVNRLNYEVGRQRALREELQEHVEKQDQKIYELEYEIQQLEYRLENVEYGW